MSSLSELGLSSFFRDQLSDFSLKELRLARITAEHRSEYTTLSPDGAGKAYLSGNQLREAESESLPKVGDWVVLDAQDRVVKVLARKSSLTRGSAGRESTNQVLATNVDVVFIVAGLDSKFNLNKIERYLSLVWSSGAMPVVVLNKADVAEDAADLLLEAEGHCPGAQVILASAKTAEGLNEIRAQLRPGVTGAFVGPSGVGKSTLINALLGEEFMVTGETRDVDSKGRHTTAHRQLIVLPEGGMVIDTPGLRELQLAESDGIAQVFPEIEALSDRCRFRDCTHQHEPGCAVISAVEEGSIQRDRYEHYLKLQHDAHSFEVRQDERLRRSSERIWGQLSREGQMIRDLKGNRR